MLNRHRLNHRSRRIGVLAVLVKLVLMTAAAALAWFGLPHSAKAQDEVPFVTTPDAVTLAMLELAGVQRSDYVVDLGSGDGRIVITAAKRFGARGLGVELVPDLVAQSQRNAQAAGVAHLVSFRQQDLFDTALEPATVITMYLLPAVNRQLRPRLLALAPGTRIVSHDWDMGDWLPDRSLTLDVPDKPIGLNKSSTVHLWVVPARVQGLWCGDDSQLQITQRFQRFSATLQSKGASAPVAVFDGQVGPTQLHTTDGRLDLAGQWLRMAQASGALGLFEGRRFKRAGAGGCGG